MVFKFGSVYRICKYKDPQSASASIQNTNSISDISPDKVSSAVVSLLNDEKEREKRCMNIIIHNLPESTAKTGEERKQDDISKITEICKQNLLQLPMQLD